MPLYVADYLRDTRRLTAAEHGAYLLLIMEYWTSGCLPEDDGQLSRIACMTAAEWRRAKPNVKPFFSDGWKHKRIDAEIAKSIELSNKRSEAAKQKGSKRQAIAEQEHQQLDTHAGATSQSPSLDRIGSAGASAFTDGSKSLSAALWRGLGFDGPLSIPTEFAGADWRAVEWEKAGWTADLIESEARRIGPGKPLLYHEKCFATAFAKRQTPLPVVEVKTAETITVTNHVKPKSAVIQAIDDLNRTIAGFDGPSRGPDELRGDAGENPPRLLSHG
jgi:uncharacterized protein YdaU (DUF1376 family)